MENIAYLSIGSNIGNRLEIFQKALQLLDEHNGISVEKLSSIYETDPVGYTNQACFLNAVLKISTSLQSEELLQIMPFY